MRALPLLVACLALMACGKKEQSFDERYETNSNQIGANAEKMEAELNRQFNAAAIAEQKRDSPAAPMTNKSTP